MPRTFSPARKRKGTRPAGHRERQLAFMNLLVEGPPTEPAPSPDDRSVWQRLLWRRTETESVTGALDFDVIACLGQSPSTQARVTRIIDYIHSCNAELSNDAFMLQAEHAFTKMRRFWAASQEVMAAFDNLHRVRWTHMPFHCGLDAAQEAAVRSMEAWITQLNDSIELFGRHALVGENAEKRHKAPHDR